jgi:pyruvate/2-oxoglutarate dehydrogenase complex dihydrolipoamide dehydrogenase (E3) component
LRFLLILSVVYFQVRDFIAEQMSLRGITFHTEESPQAITKSNDGLLSLKTNKETVGGFSHIMFATGRKPNTKVRTIWPFCFCCLVLCVSLLFYSSIVDS